MNAKEIKAKGWDAYRSGRFAVVPYKRGSWQARAYRDGYLAAEKDAANRRHRRSWDSQGHYGTTPAEQPTGSDVYDDNRGRE